ncbi:MAG: DUF177 domain-containing protein [Caldilineaceae bacterium]|nr:DUF177 domain-containing protein [Caldilineaceae bacterium]MBP8106065.1 DUF177 domain-containing protein [Caldilineaceae bacterium]MBP8121929.1 DUF177 domain-containing protein [Caldilineaceae bacterium]MBP9073359.1 DUF177 domain-containing protein [Caldilineaceae bacterium]
MQFNVAGLMKGPIGEVRRYDLEEDLSSLKPEIPVASPLTGQIQFLRTNSGILATGILRLTIETHCARCTDAMTADVDVRIEESFRPLVDVTSGRFLLPDEIEGSEDDLFDAALLINDHHILDITEVVRQTIWTSMPMRPSCAYAFPEECPKFQVRLQELAETLGDEDEWVAETAIDPRWAALLPLQETLGDDE